MTARISLIPGKTRGHRPRLQKKKPLFVQSPTYSGECKRMFQIGDSHCELEISGRGKEKPRIEQIPFNPWLFFRLEVNPDLALEGAAQSRTVLAGFGQNLTEPVAECIDEAACSCGCASIIHADR